MLPFLNWKLSVIRKLFVVMLTFASAEFSSFAYQSQTFSNEQLSVRLVSSVESVRPGQDFFVALEFNLKKDWHIYWKNPGDSGTAPQVKWSTDGFLAGEILWPLPERIPVEGLTNFGYSTRVLLPVKFKFTQVPPLSILKINADLEWLACKVECVPGFANLSLKIPVTEEKLSPDNAEILNYISKTPQGESLLEAVPSSIANDELKLLVKNGAALKAFHFFPYDSEVITSEDPKISLASEDLSLNLKLNVNRSPELKHTLALVAYTDNTGIQRIENLKVSLVAEGTWLGYIFLLAFAGGIILNLMPCVFPVLSIKILGFMGPDRDPQKLRKAGWAYTLGVLFSFLALGALLIALRNAGEKLGWGFQMQSPVFVAFLMVLFVGIALNLWGVFEVGDVMRFIPFPQKWQQGNSFSSAFATGVLATVVATPCTAPFMGTAIGFTLTQPALVALAVFGSLGLGMAAPFLILSYWTQLLKKLPRPGQWMLTFKKLLALPLMITVLWLGWILFQQLSPTQAQAPYWQKFSEKVVKEYQQKNESYFIDFTASWCITCQVNKKAVLETEEIQRLFRSKGVTQFRADWTNRSPEVTEALGIRKRNSLPLYIYYDVKTKQEVVLPELLTKQMIRDLF